MKAYAELALPIRITHYRPGSAGVRGSHDTRGNLIDPGSPPDPMELEWEFDAPAVVQDWLREHMTNRELEGVEQQVMDEIESERRSA